MLKNIGTVDRASRVQVTDLTDVPHVDALLTRLGLGPFDPSTVTSAAGRNDNWAGITTGGAAVFVKQLTDVDRAARMRRTETVWTVGGNRLDTPRLLGTDQDNWLLAFDYLEGGESGMDLAANDAFDEDLCAKAGALVAAVHGLDGTEFDTTEHPLPPVGSLAAIPLDRYTEASAAELTMWRLLHADQPIIRALQDLRENDSKRLSVRRPIHGDLRLDQFLLAGGRLYITDFEEARLGDPARDIGAFAGEWLFKAVAAIPATLANSLPFGHTATHEEIIATGVGEIERRKPLVRSFFRAYLDAAPAAVADDADLAVRAAAYAGWHMLDRMLASAVHSARLSPINKAAAGIGRTVLLSPADFTSSLGLEA